MKDKLEFTNRVAIVTGAGTGLGKAYAIELARRGALVVVNDAGISLDGKNQPINAADKVVEEITSEGFTAVASSHNVANPHDAEKIVLTALDNFGTVDILITNAGIIRDKTFHKMDIKDFEDVINVHLFGTVYTTKFAYPIMRQKGYGRILTITSNAGLYGNFGQTNYSAAKMGVIGFMKSLALEGAKYDVHTNALGPGASTRMHADGFGGFYEEIGEAASDPKNPAALATYLLHESCQSNGEIYSAIGSYFARSSIVENSGIIASPNEVSAEWIASKWSQISDTSTMASFSNATQHTNHIKDKFLSHPLQERLSDTTRE